MKKKIILPLLALGIASSAALACINNKSYICHPATPGTRFHCPDGAWVTQNADTTGTIYMAHNASSGLDSIGWFNTTCDYTTESDDCVTVHTSTPHSDPINRSYADGNPCPGG